MPSREEETHQPRRLVAGNCPECGRLCVLFNNGEAWGLLHCSCGWVGATDEIAFYVRVEAMMPWEIQQIPEGELRTFNQQEGAGT